jgi:hypothetical protein
MRSLACIEAAHNPAAAGPRVKSRPRNQINIEDLETNLPLVILWAKCIPAVWQKI